MVLLSSLCNHCPYVKAIASRLKKDADELLEHSINTIAIMSNDVINYPDDSFYNMKIWVKSILLIRKTRRESIQ